MPPPPRSAVPKATRVPVPPASPPPRPPPSRRSSDRHSAAGMSPRKNAHGGSNVSAGVGSPPSDSPGEFGLSGTGWAEGLRLGRDPMAAARGQNIVDHRPPRGAVRPHPTPRGARGRTEAPHFADDPHITRREIGGAALVIRRDPVQIRRISPASARELFGRSQMEPAKGRIWIWAEKKEQPPRRAAGWPGRKRRGERIHPAPAGGPRAVFHLAFPILGKIFQSPGCRTVSLCQKVARLDQCPRTCRQL